MIVREPVYGDSALHKETLTVHRFGVGWLLRKTLASTNPIESCFSTVGDFAKWPRIQPEAVVTDSFLS